MPYYVEFPVDNVVGVHWKKRKPDEPPVDTTPFDAKGHCGAFMNGISGGLFVGNSAVLVLGNTNLYELHPDFRPYHLPNKPNWYVPSFNDYVVLGLTPFRPFIWANPISWTLTYASSTVGAELRISEYRNVNPQKLNLVDTVVGGPSSNPFEGLAPTHRVEGAGMVSMDILTNDPADANFQYIYPPMFICEFFSEPIWVPHIHARILVQAHCCPQPPPHQGEPCTETTGFWFGGTQENAQVVTTFLPEQPPGWGTIYSPDVYRQDPAPGSTDLPLYPPPIGSAPAAMMSPSRRVAPPILPSGF